MYLRDEYRNGTRTASEKIDREFFKLFFNQSEIKQIYKTFLKQPLPIRRGDKTNLLVSAFIHQSFSHECNLQLAKNAEQLEFLGDSVLGLVVSEFLFKTYQKSSEGDYSKARNTLVNEKNLALFARELKFDRLIFLGRGELGKKGFERDSLLADTFEAFLAAVYLNYGLEISYRFVRTLLKVTKTDQVDFEEARISDAKSTLQEFFLSKYKTFPEYSAEKIMDSGEEKFACQLKLKGKILKEGVFASKKKGHKKLAKDYLLELNQNNELIL